MCDIKFSNFILICSNFFEVSNKIWENLASILIQIKNVHKISLKKYSCSCNLNKCYLNVN